jgi:hypothetical protein
MEELLQEIKDKIDELANLGDNRQTVKYMNEIVDHCNGKKEELDEDTED